MVFPIRSIRSMIIVIKEKVLLEREISQRHLDYRLGIRPRHIEPHSDKLSHSQQPPSINMAPRTPASK